MVKRLAHDPTAKKYRVGRQTVDWSPNLVSFQAYLCLSSVG